MLTTQDKYKDLLGRLQAWCDPSYRLLDHLLEGIAPWQREGADVLVRDGNASVDVVAVASDCCGLKPSESH